MRDIHSKITTALISLVVEMYSSSVLNNRSRLVNLMPLRCQTGISLILFGVTIFFLLCSSLSLIIWLFALFYPLQLPRNNRSNSCCRCFNIGCTQMRVSHGHG